MIRTTTTPVAWSLPWDPDTNFMIRAGDVIERDLFEADLAELDADRVYDFQLTETFLAGVDVLLKDHPEDAARIREVAAALETLEPGKELPADEKALLEGARQAVKSAWPPYRTLLTQAARRAQLIPTMAFQRFVTGWSGKDLPEFAKGIDGMVTLDAMKAVPPIVLRLAGQRAYGMLWATDQVGNSARLLQSDKSPRRSKGTRKRAGSSASRSGGKTPSRPSRGGRSPS